MDTPYLSPTTLQGENSEKEACWDIPRPLITSPDTTPSVCLTPIIPQTNEPTSSVSEHTSPVAEPGEDSTPQPEFVYSRRRPQVIKYIVSPNHGQ